MEQLTKARPRVANPIKNQAESTKRAQEAKAEGVKLGLLPKDIAPMSREALSKIPNADMIDYMRQHYIKQGLPADEVRRLTLANGARELFQRYGKKYSEASIRGQLANTLDQQHQKNPDLFGTNQPKETPKAEPAVIRAPEQAQTPVVSYHEKVQSALAHPDKVYGRRLYEQASREHYFKKHRDELETLSEEDPDKYVELMTKITSKIKDHANKFFPVEAAEPVKTPTETSGLRVDKDYVKPKPRVRQNNSDDRPERLTPVAPPDPGLRGTATKPTPAVAANTNKKQNPVVSVPKPAPAPVAQPKTELPGKVAKAPTASRPIKTSDVTEDKLKEAKARHEHLVSTAMNFKDFNPVSFSKEAHGHSDATDIFTTPVLMSVARNKGLSSDWASDVLSHRTKLLKQDLKA